MKIVLRGERPISWNDLYTGRHWQYRQSEAQRVHDLMALTLMGLKPIMYKRRVDIELIAYFKNRPYDPDNICSKLYVDGLKGKLIENDSYKYVARVSTRSEVDAKDPRVEIIIS